MANLHNPKHTQGQNSASENECCGFLQQKCQVCVSYCWVRWSLWKQVYQITHCWSVGNANDPERLHMYLL